MGRPRLNIGTCSVEGCEKPAQTRGWCSMHYARWQRHGDVNAVCWRTGPLSEQTKAKISVSQRASLSKGSAHHAWRGDDLTYYGAHARVKRVRGSATLGFCRCGAPAQGWAFRHDSADSSVVRHELVRAKGKAWLIPYSPYPGDYVALCASCHARLDRPALDEPCGIDGCDKRALSRGWCEKHYTRWRRYGDPLGVPSSKAAI